MQNNTRELLTLLSFMLPATFPVGLAAAFGARPGVAEAEAAEVRRARRLLAPFVLRRSKRDVLTQLAPKAEEEAQVRMTKGQHATYVRLLQRGRALVAERSGRARGKTSGGAGGAKSAKTLFFDLRKASMHPCLLRGRYTDAQVGEIARAALALDHFGAQATLPMVLKELATYSDFQLHQLCSDLPPLRRLTLPHAALCDSGKVRHLRQLLPQLRAEGHRVLLFSQSTQMLDLLEPVLGPPPGLGLPFVRLDGSTAVEERQQLIDDYQAAGSPLFAFLLSTRAGGQGITLTGADTVIIHDLDWNPQLDRQAVDRAHRIGQTRPVRVIRLVTAESVEEQILKMQQKKAGLDASLLGDGSKAPRRRPRDSTADGDEEEGPGAELDVRMMTTMIHDALSAPIAAPSDEDDAPEAAPSSGADVLTAG